MPVSSARPLVIPRILARFSSSLRVWSPVAAGVTMLASGAACGGVASSPGGTAKEAGADALLIISPPLTFDGGSKKDSGGQIDAPLAEDTNVPVDAGVDSTVIVPTDAAANTFPAFAITAPQVESNGGSVLASPVFIPVIFAGDPNAAAIPGFLSAVGASDYWKAAVTEYGVGAATASEPIILNETFPSDIEDAQLQTWLANKLGLDPRFGGLGQNVFDAGPFDAGSVDASAPLSDAVSPTASAPDGAIYVLFLPSGTNVTLQGARSCQSFGGYHNSFTYSPNGTSVVYATIPNCGDEEGFGSGFDAITAPTSHELVEAATDPNVGGNGEHAAFVSVDTNHIFWEFILGGGEVGDMCAQFPQAFFNPTEASMSAYKVQRIWSNKAAAAGEDPCQPTLSGAAEPYYFNAVPENASVPAQYEGFNFNTLGVKAPKGQPTVITLDLFSSASTNGQDWQVQAYDATSYTTGSAPDLEFSPATVSGANGYKVQLTVTNLGNDGQTTHPFLLVSSQGILQNWWIGVVSDE